MTSATRQETSGTASTVKDRADLQDALFDLRGRLLKPVSKWTAEDLAKALALVDRAIGDL